MNIVYSMYTNYKIIDYSKRIKNQIFSNFLKVNNLFNAIKINFK